MIVRCALCGSYIDFNRLDKNRIWNEDFEHENLAIKIANILERREEIGNRTLANELREQYGFTAHRECVLTDTSWNELLEEMDAVAKEMGMESRGSA